jgi:hypothetical protein
MDVDAWWEQFARWPLRDRLELLAFEAELAQLPRPLIAALWDAIDRVNCPAVPVARDPRSALAGCRSRPAYQPLIGSRLMCLAGGSDRPRRKTRQLT